MSEAKKDYLPIEETRCYKRFSKLANEIWFEAITWTEFAQRTVGRQIVTCADSVPANLCEGDGRASDVESIRFFHISRGSARELLHWIQTAEDRNLIAKDLGSKWRSEAILGGKEINGLISYRREQGLGKRVRESVAPYGDLCEASFCDD